MIFKVHGRADIENHMSSQICFCFKLFNIEPFGFSVHFPVDMFEIISLVVGPVFCKFYRETVERAAMQSGNESLCNCSGFERSEERRVGKECSWRRAGVVQNMW